MFQIKICGLTTIDDALAVAEAGADAIGLNFYPKSPRYVAPEEARRIADAVRGRLLCVGVMVNPTEAEARSLVSQVGLDAVQLHGDEPAALAARLSRSVAVVKAFRVSSQGVQPVLGYLEEFRGVGGVLRPVLFDAYRPGQFGGAGEVADWIAIKDYPSEGWHPPFVLAGGLTPDNVAAAIHTLCPAGVDTASGVEKSPGRKDPILVARFVRAAREGFIAAATS
jgi:phosphoribosylanthranilate isomerase